MEVRINVDETQFKDILEKELKDLPKEVLQNIVMESLRGYFEKDNYENIENLFIQKERNGWDTRKTSSALLDGILKDCDYSGLQEVVDEAIKNLKENYDSLLKKIVGDMIITGLFDTYSFRDKLRFAVEDAIAMRENK